MDELLAQSGTAGQAGYEDVIIAEVDDNVLLVELVELGVEDELMEFCETGGTQEEVVEELGLSVTGAE